MKRIVNFMLSWFIGIVVFFWMLTCRKKVINDPRPSLRKAGIPYVYALLHAHQISVILLNDEPQKIAAMVSRSTDGDLLIPALMLRNVLAVRGSSRSKTKDKGGMQALARLVELSKHGVPAVIAVDGPRGPRGYVHKGCVELARQSGAVVLPVLCLSSKRLILKKIWDRLQVPMPFSSLQLIFGEPITVTDAKTQTEWQQQVQQALASLEQRYDANEYTQAYASKTS